jgi:hypothetical protein
MTPGLPHLLSSSFAAQNALGREGLSALRRHVVDLQEAEAAAAAARSVCNSHLYRLLCLFRATAAGSDVL